MKGPGRSRKPVRQPGGLDWIKKRPVPIINVLIAAYFPVPTPYDQNPTWQAINKQLNADVRMNIIPTADYRTKFATTIASDDLPDIMHIYFGYSLAPNLPHDALHWVQHLFQAGGAH